MAIANLPTRPHICPMWLHGGTIYQSINVSPCQINIHFPLTLCSLKYTHVFSSPLYTNRSLSTVQAQRWHIHKTTSWGKKVERNQHAHTLGKNGEKKKNKTSAKSPRKVWNNNISSPQFLPQNCLLDIKAKVPTFSHRLRCNHVSPHCRFITQCCSAGC